MARQQGDFLESHTPPVAAALAAMHDVRGAHGPREELDQEEHPHVRGRPDRPRVEGRRMASIFTTGTSSGVGCFELGTTASQSYDVSSATACNGNQCPDCFITPTLANAVAITITSCSSAQWVSARSQTRTGVWVYTFINSDPTYAMTVTDGTTTFTLPAGSYVQAWCASTLGTTDRLYFPTTTLPTLTVESGLTVSAGNFDHSASSGTFKTGTGDITLNGNVAQSTSSAYTFATSTGAITLNGATTVADSTAFTVGSSTAGGAATFYGNVNIGGSASGAAVATTIYGAVTQNDDADGTVATFATGTGALSLNGDVTIASGKDLTMVTPGTGTFTTGTGQITLNGNVMQSSSNTFATGTGAISLNGAVTVADSTTFTVGSSTAGGAATFYGAVNIGGSASGASVATTIYGSVTQNDDADGTASTITSATGAITANGDLTIAANKNFAMTAGSGTFTTAGGLATFKGNVLIDSTNTFTTGTGAVTLNGNTAIADSRSFSVGSAGNGGSVQLFGDTYVGGSAATMSSSFTVYGNVAFNDDASGTLKTFSTATGAITLNGDTTMAQDKNLHMHALGSGTFQTGTGTVTLNGLTTVSTGKTFTVTDEGTITCSHDNTGVDSTFCKVSR